MARERIRVSPVKTRPELPHSFVLAHKRVTMIEAAIAVSACQGVHKSKLADIVKEAGVARKTFYDEFSGRTECLVAGLESIGDDIVLALQGGASAKAGHPPHVRLRAGIDALDAWVEKNPLHADFFLTQGRELPEMAIAQEAEIDRFISLLAGLAPDAPESRIELTVGSVVYLYRRAVKIGASLPRPQEVEDLMVNGLTPYGGF